MRWQLPLAALRGRARRGPGARVRLALVASVAVHVGLAWLLVDRQAWQAEVRPATTDVVEVSFEGERGPVIPAALLLPPEGNAGPVGVAVVGHGPARANGAIRGGATGVRAGEGATAVGNEARAAADVASSGVLAGASAATSAGGNADRLATFRPAHPDLVGGVRRAQDEKARDLLAAPLAKGQAGATELPKVLRGSGGVTARVGEDGSIHFGVPKDVVVNDPSVAAVGAGVGVGIGGAFDLTDQVMKLAGQDPYASAKRKIAEETREERLCMARRYQGERKKQELFDLAGKVRRLAARTDLAPAQRRALVFDIWDECTEETDTGTDYGAMARATILSIVREVFPVGSDVAYQPSELLALNQRRSSRRRFAPYDAMAAAQAGRGRHPDAGAAVGP